MDILEKRKRTLGKKRKSIIIGVSVIGLLIVLGVGGIFAIIKVNINYTKKECRNIALGYVQGEIVIEEADIDFERFTIDYKFKIKDKNNLLREIEINSKTGAIIVK